MLLSSWWDICPFTVQIPVLNTCQVWHEWNDDRRWKGKFPHQLMRVKLWLLLVVGWLVDTCIGGRQLIGSPPRPLNTWRALWKLEENESCLSRRGPPQSAGRLAALSAVFHNANREFGAVGPSTRGERNQRGWWYNFPPMSHLIHSAEGARTYLQSDFSYTCAAVAAWGMRMKNEC